MLDLAPVSRIMFGLDATKTVGPGTLLKLPIRGNFFDKPETEATVIAFLTRYEQDFVMVVRIKPDPLD